jgi:hypothetical protein
MVGEHNIKVLAVLTHQARLLVSVRPKSLLLWTSLDLGLLRRRLMDITFWAGFRWAL